MSTGIQRLSALETKLDFVHIVMTAQAPSLRYGQSRANFSTSLLNYEIEKYQELNAARLTCGQPLAQQANMQLICLRLDHPARLTVKLDFVHLNAGALRRHSNGQSRAKLCGVLCFKTFALSLRSRRQHKAWGVSPRKKIVKRSEPAKWATANGCRPFHGLDIAPNLTRGSAFGSTPGFMLPPAPRAWKNTKNLVSRVLSARRRK